MEQVGHWAAARGIRVEQILHSGVRRAKETAEILAGLLSPAAGVAEVRGMRPDDDPREAALIANHEDRDMMWVTHLPFVDDVTSLLLHGDLGRSEVPFMPGTLVHLTRNGEEWTLERFVCPGDVRT